MIMCDAEKLHDVEGVAIPSCSSKTCYGKAEACEVQEHMRVNPTWGPGTGGRAGAPALES